MPPLAQITARLKALAAGVPKGSLEPDALGALGRVFTQSADTNPNYFVVPGRKPVSDLVELQNKHGVSMEWDPRLGLIARPQGGPEAAYMSDPSVTAGQLLRESQSKTFGSPGNVRMLQEAIDRRQLNDQTSLYGIDTMGMLKNTGMAKKAYPALYEYILAHPDAANITSGLTASNMRRRSSNMTGALEKFGDRAGDRIRIDADQLMAGVNNNADGLYTADRPSELAMAYHRLSTPEKVGRLNAMIAPRTQRSVDAALRDLPTYLEGEAKALGLGDRVWHPSTDVAQDYLPRLAALIRGHSPLTGDSSAAGIDSLRRAAIAYDSVGGGLTAKDLAAQPYMTNKLARKEGGAITQCCAGCGGHLP